MSLNFALKSNKVSNKHHPKKKPAKRLIKKQHIQYMVVSCFVTVIVLAYPSWTLAKRYQLLQVLDHNVDNLEKLSTEDQVVDLKDLGDDLNSTLDQAQELQNLDDVSGKDDLEKLINDYNSLVTEYLEILKRSETEVLLQDNYRSQHDLYTDLKIKENIVDDIEISSATSLNVSLAEKKQWLEKIEENQSQITQLQQEIDDAEKPSHLKAPYQAIVGHYDQINVNLDVTKKDCRSIIAILEVFQNIYKNVDGEAISKDQEIEKISANLKIKGKLFKEQSDIVNNQIEVSDHLKILSSSIADFLNEAGQAYIEMADKIANSEAITISDIAELLDIEENVDLANNSVVDYYTNMDYVYTVLYEELDDNIISEDLRKELDLKKQQLTEIKNKLEVHRKDISESGLLKYIVN